MKKITLAIILIILLAAGGAYYFTRRNNNSTTGRQDNGPAQTSTMPSQAAYSLTDIARHNTQQDCWMAIEGKVYRIPADFPSRHPGGQAVLQGCGIDATTLFNTRPMGSKTPHSQQARQLLQSFYIGELK